VYAHYTRYTLQSDPTLTRYALTVGDDVYMACSTPLPKEAAHIVRFEPKADMSVVHHMLLYLCPSEPLVRAVHTLPAAETEGLCPCVVFHFLSTHDSDGHGLQTVVCQQASQSTGVLNMMHRLCSSGQMLAYGWGRNAPPLTLPPGVGFEIGAGSGFTHAVLEVCFVYVRAACASECSHGHTL
jgi:peptidylamidoglycolate lyase